jgi:hypothetical protein
MPSNLMKKKKRRAHRIWNTIELVKRSDNKQRGPCQHDTQCHRHKCYQNYDGDLLGFK